METALGWHVMMRLVDGRVVARDTAERRVVARVLLDQGRAVDLLVFRAADTHIHAVVMAGRAAAGRFAHDVEVSLRHSLHLPVKFGPAHLVPVRDQAHLRNVFTYVLRQEPHHGTDLDPLYEGSNLPDLLGMRVTGSFTVGVLRRVLPRVRRGELLALLPVQSWDDPKGIAALAETVAAVAAGTAGDALRDVRHAAAHAVGASESAASLGRELGVSARSIQRWRAKPANPLIVDAIRLHRGLRAALGPAER